MIFAVDDLWPKQNLSVARTLIRLSSIYLLIQSKSNLLLVVDDYVLILLFMKLQNSPAHVVFSIQFLLLAVLYSISTVSLQYCVLSTSFL